MPRTPTYQAEQAVIRKHLKELGYKVTLRAQPLPSVFLDGDLSARFSGVSWLTVYADVMAFFLAKQKQLAS